jgi:hypothetical protein
MSNLYPITPQVARLRAGDAPGTIRAQAVVGGAVCIQATTASGTEEFYFELKEATAFAHELADALDLARAFLRADVSAREEGDR